MLDCDDVCVPLSVAVWLGELLPLPVAETLDEADSLPEMDCEHVSEVEAVRDGDCEGEGELAEDGDEVTLPVLVKDGVGCPDGAPEPGAEAVPLCEGAALCVAVALEVNVGLGDADWLAVGEAVRVTDIDCDWLRLPDSLAVGLVVVEGVTETEPDPVWVVEGEQTRFFPRMPTPPYPHASSANPPPASTEYSGAAASAKPRMGVPPSGTSMAW